MRILIILLFFLLINGCSNQNLSSVFKKNNNEKSEMPIFGIDNNLSFQEFKNKIIEYGTKSSFPTLDNWYDKKT